VSGFFGINNMYTNTVWVMVEGFLKDRGGLRLADAVVHDLLGKTVYFYNAEEHEGIAELSGEWDVKAEKTIEGVKVVLYAKKDTVVVDVIYGNKTLRMDGTTQLALVPHLKGKPVREIMAKVRGELEMQGVRTGTMSLRDGFTMFMAEKGDKRVAVWLRSAPITPKAMEIFNKMISKYTIDGVLIFRLDERPEQTAVPYKLKYPSTEKDIVKTIISELEEKGTIKPHPEEEKMGV